jgi:hypothetical protein
VRYGVEICKDMDFPALTQRYADANVELLLVPAWDFRVDGWLHSRMAIMRGVENDRRRSCPIDCRSSRRSSGDALQPRGRLVRT